MLKKLISLSVILFISACVMDDYYPHAYRVNGWKGKMLDEFLQKYRAEGLFCDFYRRQETDKKPNFVRCSKKRGRDYAVYFDPETRIITSDMIVSK